MLLKGGKDILGLRATLVVLGLVHPANHATGIGQDRGGDGQPGQTRRPGMDLLVSQPIEIRDFEAPVGEHGGLQLVLLVPFENLRGAVGADRDDLDLTFVKLRPEFLPSP
jgi:hypothetical protein